MKLYTRLLPLAVSLAAVVVADAANLSKADAFADRTDFHSALKARYNAPRMYSEIPSVSDLNGVYDLEYCSDGWMELENKAVSVSAAPDENTFLINGIWEDFSVTASFDPDNGLISISNQVIDPENGIRFCNIQEDPIHDNFVILNTDYRTHMAGQDLVYEDGNVFGIVDNEGEILLTAFDAVFFRMISMEESEWDVLSDKAIYKDGWFAPAIKTEIPPYEVEVWRNKKNPALFAFINPYGPETPFASYNMDTYGKGVVIVDTTDPGCVLVKWRNYCGLQMEVEFDEGDFYDTSFYPFNLEEDNFASLSRSYDEIKASFEEQGLVLSNYKDGVITIHNCIWGDQDNRSYDYSFDDEDLYQTVITLPSTNVGVDITPAEHMARPVYYNLQGVKVSTPTTPGLYLRKQDHETQKILIK